MVVANIIPIGYDNKVARNEGISNLLVLKERIELVIAKNTHQKDPRSITLEVKLGVQGLSVVGMKEYSSWVTTSKISSRRVSNSISSSIML
jgi:hypothetical protein